MTESTLQIPWARARGATLLEILITVLLVSITLLGGVRATTEAIGSLTDTLYYQRAARIAADLNELYALNPTEFTGTAPEPTDSGCTGSELCTPEEWLARQLGRLHSETSQLIPAGVLELNPDGIAVSGAPTASIRWQARDGQRIEMQWQPAP